MTLAPSSHHCLGVFVAIPALAARRCIVRLANGSQRVVCTALSMAGEFVADLKIGY